MELRIWLAVTSVSSRTCYPYNMDFSQTLSEALETELKVPENIEYLEANKDFGKKELVK